MAAEASGGCDALAVEVRVEVTGLVVVAGLANIGVVDSLQVFNGRALLLLLIASSGLHVGSRFLLCCVGDGVGDVLPGAVFDAAGVRTSETSADLKISSGGTDPLSRSCLLLFCKGGKIRAGLPTLKVECFDGLVVAVATAA